LPPERRPAFGWLPLARRLRLRLTWAAFATQQPVLAVDAAEHPVINRAMWSAHGRPASMLFEAVQQADETVGVLVVGWTQRVSDLRSGRPALISLLAAEAATATHGHLAGDRRCR
jgi:hypothetical protein